MHNGLTNYSFKVGWVLLNVIFVISRAYWFFREKGRWFWRPPRTTARSCVGAPGGWCYQVDVTIERPAKCLVKYYRAGSPREINKVVLYFYRPFYRGWLVPVTSRYTVGERGAEADGHSQLHGATVWVRLGQATWRPVLLPGRRRLEPRTAGVGHEALVGPQRGSDRLPHGVQGNQGQEAPGQIRSNIWLQLLTCKSLYIVKPRYLKLDGTG